MRAEQPLGFLILSCTFAFRHLLIQESRLTQASPAWPVEFPGQGSLQTHNISILRILSAGPCRDELNLQNMHPCQWRPSSHNVICLGTSDDGEPLLLLTPPLRVKGITPPPDVITAPAVLPAGDRGCHFLVNSMKCMLKIPKGDELSRETTLKRRVRGRPAAQKHRSASAQPLFWKQLRQATYVTTGKQETVFQNKRRD